MGHVRIDRAVSALRAGMSGSSGRSSLTKLSQLQNSVFLRTDSSFSHAIERDLVLKRFGCSVRMTNRISVEGEAIEHVHAEVYTGQLPLVVTLYLIC